MTPNYGQRNLVIGCVDIYNFKYARLTLSLIRLISFIYFSLSFEIIFNKTSARLFSILAKIILKTTTKTTTAAKINDKIIYTQINKHKIDFSMF